VYNLFEKKEIKSIVGKDRNSNTALSSRQVDYLFIEEEKKKREYMMFISLDRSIANGL